MYTRAGLANWVGAISVWSSLQAINTGQGRWWLQWTFLHTPCQYSLTDQRKTWPFPHGPEALGFLDMSVTMSTTHILSARHSFGASSAPYTSSDPPYVSCIVTLISSRDSDPLICDKWTLVPPEPNSNWASKSPLFVWAWCMGLAFG